MHNNPFLRRWPVVMAILIVLVMMVSAACNNAAESSTTVTTDTVKPATSNTDAELPMTIDTTKKDTASTRPVKTPN